MSNESLRTNLTNWFDTFEYPVYIDGREMTKKKVHSLPDGILYTLANLMSAIQDKSEMDIETDDYMLDYRKNIRLQLAGDIPDMVSSLLPVEVTSDRIPELLRAAAI